MATATIPADVLDDLAARFLMNLPEEERYDDMRLAFQLEQAHWFYSDYYASDAEQYDDCPRMQFRPFCRCVAR